MTTKVIKLTKKEYELIMFIRRELPFGECKLIIHNGEPAFVDNIDKKRFFGLDKEIVEKPAVDNSF